MIKYFLIRLYEVLCSINHPNTQRTHHPLNSLEGPNTNVTATAINAAQSVHSGEL